MTLNKFNILFVLFLFSLKVNSQSRNLTDSTNQKCSFDPAKIIGKWLDYPIMTRTTSIDSINKILEEIEGYKTNNSYLSFIEDFHLNFSQNEITAFGTTSKYYISNNICSLITIIDEKKNKLKAQKIYFLTDKYLVIQSCTNDCFTMFYIKT